MIIFFRLLSFFPLKVIHSLGAGCGILLGLLSPESRRIAQANLEQAKQTFSVWQALRENGRAVLELAWVWLRPTHTVMSHVITQSTAPLDAAIAQNRGVILLTPHMGCFEVTAQWFAARYHSPLAQSNHLGTPITVLYRPSRKRWLATLLAKVRARHNLQLASADTKGVRLMLKALRKGQAIGLLPDQVPSKGEGVWVNWFEKPAYTMTLPGKLAASCNAPIVLAVALRQPKSRGWMLHFEPFNKTLTGDPVQDTACINHALEKLVRLAPVQYWWTYKRYKGLPSSSATPIHR